MLNNVPCRLYNEHVANDCGNQETPNRTGLRILARLICRAYLEESTSEAKSQNRDVKSNDVGSSDVDSLEDIEK